VRFPYRFLVPLPPLFNHHAEHLARDCGEVVVVSAMKRPGSCPRTPPCPRPTKNSMIWGYMGNGERGGAELGGEGGTTRVVDRSALHMLGLREGWRRNLPGIDGESPLGRLVVGHDGQEHAEHLGHSPRSASCQRPTLNTLLAPRGDHLGHAPR